MNSSPEQQSDHTDWSDAALDAEPVLSHRLRHGLGWGLVAVLVATLLFVLPPLLNVSRYQRRVAQAISASIGRPVHFDQIHLHLLPLPGLTIQNFVVDEDPAFGAEPALRANIVEARLRFSSLWRRRVEVSHITLQAPSINLVRRTDGRWNLQGVVTEAGHLQNAPTAQTGAGPAPRFPYIEATDARINIKSGETKLPWSLLEANLALWLPDETEWRVRLRGRPLRTDTDVSDVGELELEGSLGRRSGSSPAGVLDQPLAISAHWASTPLGETAKLFLGRDTGLRGAASAELEVRGTPAHMRLTTDLHLHNLRRAEFVPRLPMSVNAHCDAEAMGVVHALHNIHCAIPTAQSADLFQGVFRQRDEHIAAAPDVLFIRADVPDLLRASTATATVSLQKAQPEYFLNWLRVLSNRIPEPLNVTGTVALQASFGIPQPPGWSIDATCSCILPAPAGTSPAGTNADVANPAGTNPIGTNTAATDQPSKSQSWSVQLTTHADTADDTGASQGSPAALAIQAVPLGDAPAASDTPSTAAILPASHRGAAPIAGQLSRNGATLQYASADLARYAASLLPPLGDGMPASVAADPANHSPLQSDRAWGGPQQWTSTPPSAPAPVRHKRRR